MSASNRTDWALLLLRLAVGGAAVLHGVSALMHARGALTFANAAHWGQALGVAFAGGFVLIGLWTQAAAAILATLVGWPLVSGWARGAALLSDPDRLFRLVVIGAAAVGGAGKWGVGK